MITDSLHAMTQFILENATQFNWSIQGFGMLRLYLPQDMRMNVWHSKFRVPNVSLIHTHPWNFESYIERGTLTNVRFESWPGSPTREPNYESALIKPGPGGGVMESKGRVLLEPRNEEFYRQGSVYSQEAHEIHLSNPADGCVTINLRRRVGADEALVFWPVGESWVSAEPREATDAEVREITHAAILQNPLKAKGGAK